MTTRLKQPDWDTIGDECGIDIRSPLQIGEGWDATAWLVNDDLVVKLGKRPESGPQLALEARVLKLLENRLSVSIPQIRHFAEESIGWHHGYLIETRIAGDSLADLPDRPRQMAAHLGRMLKELHQTELPSSDFELEQHRYQDWDLLERATALIRKHRSAAKAQQVKEQAERVLGTTAYFDFHPCLIHGDLHDQHIIQVDSSTTGVIDWGDVHLGDADTDFLRLWQFDKPFCRVVVNSYDAAGVTHREAKLNGLGLLMTLTDLTYSPKYGTPGDLERALEAIDHWTG